jgi:CubicO group peptidase (beta-lactamase class C family)
MTVTGVVADGYEPLRTIFERLVTDGRETGAGLSVWSGGVEVVQLSGGWSDRARTRAWAPDTLVHTYSTSKPFAALTALTVVADGHLGLDEPVATVWPGYAANGKQDTTLRHILTHRAGLPAFPDSTATVDLLDDEALRAALAAAEPEYPPGSRLAEHAVTYGHLLDGVIRAATGRSLGQVYAETVRPALGIDAWFGVPDADLDRVADVEYALPGGAAQFVAEVCPSYDRVLTYPKGALEPDRLNTTAWRQSVFPAIGLHASATALAQFYSTLTSPDGPVRKLLGEHLHAEYTRGQVLDVDATVGLRVNWTLGPLCTDCFIGLGGLGGSAAWWSLTNEHAVAYVTRRLHDHSRVAEFAIALGDNLTMEVTDR